MRFAANIPGASTHMLTLFESSLLRFRFFLKSRLYVISIIIIKAKADIHPSIPAFVLSAFSRTLFTS